MQAVRGTVAHTGALVLVFEGLQLADQHAGGEAGGALLDIDREPLHQLLLTGGGEFEADKVAPRTLLQIFEHGIAHAGLHTNDLTNLALNVGACAAPAPAMSWRGLALLMLLLVGFGSLSLVPRRS